MLPALAQLEARQDETGTERDPSYVAANFSFLNKLQGMGLYLNRDGGFGGSLSKEFLRKTMTSDDPEVTTVTSKGQIAVPSRLREQFGLEKGTKLMVVPTDYGLVLKQLELPSVEEFQQRVEERADEIDFPMEEVDELVRGVSDAER